MAHMYLETNECRGLRELYVVRHRMRDAPYHDGHDEDEDGSSGGGADRLPAHRFYHHYGVMVNPASKHETRLWEAHIDFRRDRLECRRYDGSAAHRQIGDQGEEGLIGISRLSDAEIEWCAREALEDMDRDGRDYGRQDNCERFVDYAFARIQDMDPGAKECASAALEEAYSRLLVLDDNGARYMPPIAERGRSVGSGRGRSRPPTLRFRSTKTDATEADGSHWDYDDTAVEEDIEHFPRPSRSTPSHATIDIGEEDLAPSTLKPVLPSSPRPASPYDKVKVLTIVWEDHDLPWPRRPPSTHRYNPRASSSGWEHMRCRSVDDEVEVVAAAFRGYNYDVSNFKIPMRHSRVELVKRLGRLGEYQSPKTLLILYYNGHGALDENNDLIFYSHENEGSRLYWKDISPMILNFQCDVLTILDCCHSGAAALDRRERESYREVNRNFSKELIGTSGFETTSFYGAACSFAPIMRESLEAHRLNSSSSVLDTSSFFQDITEQMLRHYLEPSETETLYEESAYDYETGPYRVKVKGKKPSIATNPVHMQLAGGKAKGIVLAPLPPSPTSSSAAPRVHVGEYDSPTSTPRRDRARSRVRSFNVRRSTDSVTRPRVYV